MRVLFLFLFCSCPLQLFAFEYFNKSIDYWHQLAIDKQNEQKAGRKKKALKEKEKEFNWDRYLNPKN